MATYRQLLVLFGTAFTLVASARGDSPSLFTSTVLNGFNDASEKVVKLADALSDEQYAWRPGEGVRSSREVLLHIAGANFYFATMLGAKLPEGVNPRELEKTATTKAAVIAVLKQSIDVARSALQGISEADLATEIDLFGHKAPKARLVLLFDEHAHEHLGQLIAYARVNGVTPPWSM